MLTCSYVQVAILLGIQPMINWVPATIWKDSPYDPHMGMFVDDRR